MKISATVTASAGQKVYRKWFAGTMGRYPKIYHSAEVASIVISGAKLR